MDRFLGYPFSFCYRVTGSRMRRFSSSTRRGSSTTARLVLFTDCLKAREAIKTSLTKVGMSIDAASGVGESQGVHIDIVYSATLSRLRRLLKLPRFMTPVSYEKIDPISSSTSSYNTSSSSSSSITKSPVAIKYEKLSVMEIIRNFAHYTQARPVLPFKFDVPSKCSYIEGKGNDSKFRLKEIVVGTGSHNSPPSSLPNVDHTRKRHKSIPIYEMDHGVHIRLLPSTSSYLIFSSDAPIDDNKYEYESIGQNNTSRGQLKVLDDHDMVGVGVRICNDDAIKPFFNEGSEILLENSLPELQNSRVLDTSVENKFSHNFGFAGDCWGEFHQMIRRPLSFINKTEAYRLHRQQQNTVRTRSNNVNVSLKE